MAESPSHKFGQVVGDCVESAIEPFLRALADTYGLYLDKEGPRPARRGKKVKWRDKYGNEHNLDYVLERDAEATTIGTPVAFIESAWRRYTKHSRNKAQEIQGAILPLVTTHSKVGPFIGVVVAGIFTEGSLTQLRSQGFSVLHFPYETVVQAFASVGIDAAYDEATPDSAFAKKVKAWEKLSKKKKAHLEEKLVELNRTEVDNFVEELTCSVTRRVESVRVLVLHGDPVECASADDAIRFVEEYDLTDGAKAIARFEIEVRFNNGAKIGASFPTKNEAIAFLRDYQPHPLTPVG